MSIFKEKYWVLVSPSEQKGLGSSLRDVRNSIGNPLLVCYKCGLICDRKHDWYTFNDDKYESKHFEYKKLVGWKEKKGSPSFKIVVKSSFENISKYPFAKYYANKNGYCESCFQELRGQLTMVEPKQLEGSLSIMTKGKISEVKDVTC